MRGFALNHLFDSIGSFITLIFVAAFLIMFAAFVMMSLEYIFFPRKNVSLLNYAENKITYRSPSNLFGFIGLDLIIFMVGLTAASYSVNFLKHLVESTALILFLKFIFSSFVSVACFLLSYVLLREIDLNRVTVFDKDREVVSVKRQTILGKRVTRYPLQEICNVKLEAGGSDDDGQDNYQLVAIFNNGISISLDSFSTTGEEIDEIREQAAKKIKIFLSI